MAERAKGCDLSAWNQVTDWQSVKTAGLDFAFIKATEGVGYRAEYKSQWDGAGSIGLLRSGYHYLHGEAGGAAQADYFMAHATKGELPPAVDFEDVDTLLSSVTGARMFEVLRAYCLRIESAWDVTPIIYSGKWFMDMCLNSSNNYNPRWMANFPLWVACYWEPRSADKEPLRYDWHPWTFYQWTSSGAIPGIVGRVDLNVFQGDRAALRKFAGIEDVPLPVPTDTFEERLQAIEKWIKAHG